MLNVIMMIIAGTVFAVFWIYLAWDSVTSNNENSEPETHQRKN